MRTINVSDCDFRVMFANEQLTETGIIDSMHCDLFAITTENRSHNVIKIEVRDGQTLSSNLIPIRTIDQTEYEAIETKLRRSRMKPINIYSDCDFGVMFADDNFNEVKIVTNSNATGFAIVTEGNDHKLIKIEVINGDCLADCSTIRTISQEEYDAIGTKLETWKPSLMVACLKIIHLIMPL